MNSPMKNVIRVLAASFAAFLVFAAVAAAETTKTEYKELVEPICKTNSEASDKYLKGVKNLVKNDKLKQASESFTKAANALEKAQKQLAAVEQPPADSAKLNKWLSGIKGEISLMREIATAFKSGNKGKGSSLAVKLQHNATTTNNQVISYAFKYCKIDPSKYT